MITATYHNMLNIVNKLFGGLGSKNLKTYDKIVKKINDFETEISKLDDQELKNKTQYFKNQFDEKQKTIDDILPEAFAVVREASKRTLKMRHFDVQLIGGIVLHEGKIAEMKTGEGKTLAATLPVYLNVIAGKSVHIVTVNDYLAKRDSEWMGQIYNFLNLSVGCVNSQTPHENRPREYEKDVVYATNNEIGFDYLRDNLKGDYESLCFKKDAFAIVDEVDSILIDEARTPLVISAESNTSVDLFPQINKIIKLFKDSDYEINEEGKSVLLTNEGMEFAEKLLLENNLIKEGTLQDLDNMALNHNIIQALRAHKLFIRDKDYILKDKQVVIIDDLSGRPMEGRRYGDGLHQAIEAKEGLTIQKENQTIASVTYQNFFRSYSKLSGMTGTAQTEANEFEGIYNLAVVSIPS
jgi:preprotein translocase subunit SecA